MPQTYISKEFTVETGHAVGAGYKGRCRFIHGHSYTITLELTAPELDRFGMVTDFHNLDPIKDWMDNAFDHCLLLNGNDPKHRQAAVFLTDLDLADIYLMDGNPTAENIAAEVLDYARRILGGVVVSVTVWETAKANARITITAQEAQDVS